LKWREVVRLLRADGWFLDSQKGGHMHFKHPTKPGKVTVPVHSGKDINGFVLNNILKQAGLK